MSIYKDRSFTERQSAAAEAKKAQLEKFRAKIQQDDPAVAERRAARMALVEARERRRAEKEAARKALLAQQALEKAAREEAERLEKEALELERRAEEAAHAKSRPRQIIKDFAEYAQRRAASGSRL